MAIRTASLVLSLCGWMWSGWVTPCSAMDYHLRDDGDDVAGDGSLAKPWCTPTPVNALDLEPGDRVLLAGGSTIIGSLRLGPEDAGTATDPVTIASYGEGRATLVCREGTAIDLKDCGGVVIRDLDLHGGAVGTDTKGHHGIQAYTDSDRGARLPALAVVKVRISAFGDDGLKIGSWHATNPGYDGIRIDRVETDNTGGSGILLFNDPAAAGYAHRDLIITGCTARQGRSGSGIVVSGVAKGRIERCRASGNQGKGGGVGIWAYASSEVTIAECIADGTRSAAQDGGGFDLDGGCTGCVIERCVSYDNDGPGFMHCDYPAAKPTRGNVIRDCLSIDDGRKAKGGPSGFGFVSWGSGLDHCQILDTIAIRSAPHARSTGGLFVHILTGWEKPGDHPGVADSLASGNRVVVAAPGNACLQLDQPLLDTTSVRFQRNAYLTVGPETGTFLSVRAKGDAAPEQVGFAVWQDSAGQDRDSSHRHVDRVEGLLDAIATLPTNPSDIDDLLAAVRARLSAHDQQIP